MKRFGRFTKAKVIKANERFLEGQSLKELMKYKQTQTAIKGHLINLN